MPRYKVALGHDVALLDLDDIIGQCSTPGMQYTRRSYAASGIVIDELPFVEFEFSTLSVAKYQALLTQFGLSDATSADVTVYIQNENFEWVRRNGKAVKPQIGVDGERDNYLLRNFTFLVTKLRVVA